MNWPKAVKWTKYCATHSQQITQLHGMAQACQRFKKALLNDKKWPAYALAPIEKLYILERADRNAGMNVAALTE